MRIEHMASLNIPFCCCNSGGRQAIIIITPTTVMEKKKVLTTATIRDDYDECSMVANWCHFFPPFSYGIWLFAVVGILFLSQRGMSEFQLRLDGR
jgi:hypothetical protein